MNEQKCFYTIPELSKMLDLHPNSIRNAIKRGSINALKIASHKRSRYRIPYSELERLAIVNLEKVKEREKKIKKEDL